MAVMCCGLYNGQTWVLITCTFTYLLKKATKTVKTYLKALLKCLVLGELS